MLQKLRDVVNIMYHKPSKFFHDRAEFWQEYCAENCINGTNLLPKKKCEENLFEAKEASNLNFAIPTDKKSLSYTKIIMLQRQGNNEKSQSFLKYQS